MQRILQWGAALWLSLALLGSGAALALPASAGAVIGNGTISLGVSDYAGLGETDVGLEYAPTHADGLARPCACSGWTVALGDAALDQSLDTFTFDALGAHSSVLVADP